MNVKDHFVLFLAILFLSLIVMPDALIFAWPVPDTGQTKCYNNTEEIPCPSSGESFYGQDANYTINPMFYTKLDASGNDLPESATSWVMVRDNVTGLIWEIKQDKDGMANYTNPHDADNIYTWYNPTDQYPGTSGDGTDTEDFINALNAAKYGGYNNWRVPSINELASVIQGPDIDSDNFQNTQSGNSLYWSRTTLSFDPAGAWGLYFPGGQDHTWGGGWDDMKKNHSNYVLAVRGQQMMSLDNLVINSDGTVTDKDTGLMWQQATAPGTYTWQQALEYAENLDKAGYVDWRLPNVKELRSLVDFNHYDPSINTTYFPDTAPADYWSSNTAFNDFREDCAWYLGFYFGDADTFDSFGSGNKDHNLYVRAIRGGQTGSLGHLVILSPNQASALDIGVLMPIRWNTTGLGTSVKISLSLQGGLDNTFDTIIETTPNDGQYDWTITGTASVNCVIKIEQADNPSNWATEGLFVIKDPGNSVVNPAIFLLLL